jgi:DNA-binding transcriptional LysR family regulator
MELRHLRYFVAVAEVLNFTKAATRLRLAQPALSRQVADLEDELGVDLLSRTSHGVRLTEEGKLFLTEAWVVLNQVDGAVTKVRALARGEFGELQAGYVPPLDLHILPRALAEFRKATPGVSVSLHDSGTDEICQDLRAGKLHFALMMQPSEELMAGIEFEEIGRYPFFVAMAPGHTLARMKTISRENLSPHPLVVLDRKKNSEFYRILKRVLAQRQPNVAVESDSVNSLITEVSSGRCVAVVSQLFKEAVGKRLLYRKLVDAGAAMVIGIARAKDGDLPPAGEKLCATIRKLGRASRG